MTFSAALAGHSNEPHDAGHGSRLNWLRAGVLGANDGIVSVAALLLGVIAAGAGEGAILAAGVASLIAGAVSMALGEYVSVSAQRDSEKMLVAKERAELADDPEAEHAELAGILASYGISDRTAAQAATEIHQKDALPAHLQLELGIEAEDLTSPVAAAVSSAGAFTLGAALPLLAVLVVPAQWATPVVTVVTLIALLLTGFIAATLAGTSRLRSSMRLFIGGAAGLALTYFAGALFGAAG
ncbi:VIT1/CCC1 transporter family protein [Corynebacterium comes]|uniref:VIT family protein n=1 Tax=Corynebacterium comes TaxID=2675218 RepID=A0A6B8VY25_9CORY|nr:VIT family protein [Corynebacterium comes]QGU05061.1 VIT family protein [Corynebacterium comes]